LNLPHRVCESTCYVNGLEDILEWKSAKYMYYLLSVLGGMGEFAYLKFKAASIPCMVYWGASPKYLMNDLEKIIGFKQEIIENRVFKSTFTKIKEFIDLGLPVVAGALDMCYLHYYKDLYMMRHVPIHYVLVVGYDDIKQVVFVHDCTYQDVKEVSYKEFEKALDVNVPGMSKKNTIRIFIMPDKLPTEFEIAKKGLNLRAEKMLNPPVSLFGIPAMKKLSKEIISWKGKSCFDHLVMYATIPPHIPKNFNNSNGMRFWKADILQELGNKYNIINWVRASELFKQSGEIIIDICKAAVVQDSQLISDLISKVAVMEEVAYKLVKT
jgi:hypothetical protein